MDSKLGLIFQLNGVFLITILSLFLRRSLKVTALKYWTIAWLCLSFALICLRLGFSYSELGTLLFSYYFFGEYIFGFMLVAGCRSLDGKYQLRARAELFIIPFVAIAIILPLLASDLSEILHIHSLILAGFYASAYFAMRKSTQRSFGWRVMHVSLFLLALELLLYFVVFSMPNIFSASTSYLEYSTVFDLVLQTSLGFGMVIVLLEKVLFDYKSSNERLQAEQKRLEELVHTDPLTAAFNRHAFYGFVKRNGEEGAVVSGCVGFFDIDDLKSINDSYGHVVGDAVIRSVVKAIRGIIRAEDLIYRWGGDEFFVVMISMSSEMAEARVSRLEGMLRSTEIDNLPEPIEVGVSWGFKDFADAAELEKSIADADSAMYRRKKERKRQGKVPMYINPTPTNISEIVQ